MDWDINRAEGNQIKDADTVPFAQKWKQTDTYLKMGEVMLKIIFTIMLLLWIKELVTKPQPWIFIDYANYIIHEMGHFIFMPFGEFLSILGGTILQISVPLFILIYFLKQKNIYSTAFSLFWIGDVLVNVSVYIGDARTMSLPLASLTSVTYTHGNAQMHDWYRMLTQLNILHYDKAISAFVFFIAFLCLAGGIIVAVLNISTVVNEIRRIRISLKVHQLNELTQPLEKL